MAFFVSLFFVAFDWCVIVSFDVIPHFFKLNRMIPWLHDLLWRRCVMICMDSYPGQYVVCEKEAGSTFPTQTVWHLVWWWHWPVIIIHMTSSMFYIVEDVEVILSPCHGVSLGHWTMSCWGIFTTNFTKSTLPKTNKAPANRQNPKVNLISLPNIHVFRGNLAVSFREGPPWCDLCKLPTSPGYDLIDAQIPIEYVSRLARRINLWMLVGWMFHHRFVSPRKTVDVCQFTFYR